MSTHHKPLTFVLTTFLVLSLPSGAESQGELPGMEPLEGVAAKLDNEQDFRGATASFEDGLLALESVIFDEGLRRAIKNDEENGRSSSQRSLEAAAKTLRLCKDSCETPEEKCRDPADRRSNILLATSCEISFGECEVKCTQNLLDTVSRMPDPPSDTQAQENEDPAMEQQRHEALAAVLVQDARKAENAAQQAVFDLQRVALKEGIRDNLEEYAEYGVPPGPTATTTAVNNLEKCSQETISQHTDCVLEDELSPAPLLLLRSLSCALVSTVRQLGCGKDVVTRYLGN